MANAKITWLGGPGEPAECEWNGHVFPKGQAVEVSDAFMIKKAKQNPHFEVDDPTADHMAKMRTAKAAKKAPAKA